MRTEVQPEIPTSAPLDPASYSLKTLESNKMKTVLGKSKTGDSIRVGHADCAHCAIRSHALFAGIPDSALDKIQHPIDNISYAPHATVYQAGTRNNAIFSIRQGKVKLVQHLPNGTLRTVRLLRKGDTLGLEAMLELPYRHSAIVVKTANICRIPNDVIHTLKQEHPQLGQQLLLRMQHQLDAADQFITEFSTGSAEARVARLLLFLDRTSISDYCELLGREEMASMLGITTETASRLMADFRRRGIISGVINIDFACDHAQLQLIAQDM